MSAVALKIDDSVEDELRATGIDFINLLVRQRDHANLFHDLQNYRQASCTALISPKTADTILSFVMRNQRERETRHVMKLAMAMKNNEFMRGNALVVAVQVDSASPNAREVRLANSFLIDGQHRLKAISQSDKTLPQTVVFLIVNTDEERTREAVSIDRGKRRSHRDIAHIAELSEKIGLSAIEAGRYAQAVTAVVRYGLDPDSPFNPKDAENTQKLLDIYDYYASVGRGVFNIYNFGKLKPTQKDREIRGSGKKADLRDLTILAPLIVATKKFPNMVENFLAPVIEQETGAMSKPQHLFVDIVVNKLIIKPGEFSATMDYPMPRWGKQTGTRSQLRVIAAVLKCFNAYRTTHSLTRGKLIRAVLETVDKTLDRNEPIVWEF